MRLIMTSVENSFCVQCENWDIQEKKKKREEWISLPRKETNLESVMEYLQVYNLIWEITNGRIKKLNSEYIHNNTTNLLHSTCLSVGFH